DGADIALPPARARSWDAPPSPETTGTEARIGTWRSPAAMLGSWGSATVAMGRGCLKAVVWDLFAAGLMRCIALAPRVRALSVRSPMIATGSNTLSTSVGPLVPVAVLTRPAPGMAATVGPA